MRQRAQPNGGVSQGQHLEGRLEGRSGGGHKPSGDDHTHQVEEELALSAWPGLTHPQPGLNSGHSLNTEAMTAHAPGESN